MQTVSNQIFKVECPCGSVMANQNLDILITEVQTHAKDNHQMELSREDVEDMVYA
jgi:hypothetical protein